MRVVFFFILISLSSYTGFAQDLNQISKAKPFDLSGGINVQGQIYSIDGAPARQPWNSYVISGSPTLSIYGIQLPFTFTLSNNQRDFRQPFNQIGVSPQYKWMKFHAGYRSVNFSQFGLAGHMMLGGGIELNPKKFRFGLMYGRTNKAVEEDTTKTITQNLNSINYPAYKRLVLAGKIGLGTADNYTDLYFVKGKDDSTSLSYKPTKTEVLPGENLVVGLTHKYSFFKKKLEWQSDGAVSAYSRDLTAPEVDLSEVKQAKLIQSIMTPNFSTVIYAAMESQVKYKHKYFTLGGKYRRIEPDYKSMGAYFFQTDLEQMTFNFTARLFKNKLNLNGSAGVQNDNISRKKIATTTRNIYSFVANYAMNKNFGIDMNLSNYGTAQKAGTKNLSDTAKINQISNSILVSPHYFFQKNNKAHSFILLVGNQDLNDRNIFTSTYTEMQMLFSNLNYSLTDMEKKITYLSGVNYTKNTASFNHIELFGVNMGAGKNWLKDKLTSDVSFIANATKFNGASNGFLLTFSMGNTYLLAKRQTLRAQINWLLNQSKNEAAGKSFNEFTCMVQYQYIF